MCFVSKISSEMAKLCFSDIRKWFHAKLLLRRRHQSWSRSWELKSFFPSFAISPNATCWWLATMWFDGSAGFAQSQSHSLHRNNCNARFFAKVVQACNKKKSGPCQRSALVFQSLSSPGWWIAQESTLSKALFFIQFAMIAWHEDVLMESTFAGF